MNRLAQLISQAGKHYAHKTALICEQQELSFAEVEAASNRLASALGGHLGVAKGARVGLLLPNSPEFVISDWALIKAGLVRVPVNPRLSAEEMTYILQDCQAEVVVTGGEYAAVILERRSQLPRLRHLILTGGAATAGCQAWDQVLAAGDPAPFSVATTMDDPYMILYTSGTTGRPKGALTTVRSRWETLFFVYANEDFVNRTDVMLHVASLAHGSGTKVLPHYIKGATNVLLPHFTLDGFCQTVQERRVTTTWLVPTLIIMLLDFAERSRYDLSSLRTVVYAGAPMPAERLREAIAAFGPVLVQVYGLSEAPQPALVLTKEDHLINDDGQTARLGSAGRPAIGVDVKVVAESGETVSPGEIGEIILGGDHLMVGYLGNPAATAEVLQDGWFRTGDLARVDDEGYVHIVDRKKDMIISGGFNVYPREVEEALYQHPAVGECAVIGVPDDVWGEAVKAVVALRPGLSATAEELMVHCSERLAGYKKPRSVDFLASLPKSANGKILKREIRSQYWGDRPRQI